MTSLDVQGHRGSRGTHPENSLPSFAEAIQVGATTLELDLCVSMDNQLVVSHEPWMNAEICKLPNGDKFPASKQKELNLYRMTYEEIARYDCGSKGHPGFPDQKAMSVVKPTLSMVVESMDRLSDSLKRNRPRYNIEIKFDHRYVDQFHPDVAPFCQMVIEAIEHLHIKDRCTVQSFDFDILNYIIEHDPAMHIALLIGSGQDYVSHLSRLSRKPDTYSPHYSLVKKEMVDHLHEQGILVVPWTVNEVEIMRRMIGAGVDGIITDYPRRLVDLINGRNPDHSTDQ